MQTSAGRNQAGSAASDLAQRYVTGIAHGTTLIAGLTILSRLFGLIRTLVFSQTVGASCLGTAYVTANQVPNPRIRTGPRRRATSAMIPVLARSAERADSDPAEKAHVSLIPSVLLTWAVVILAELMPAHLVVAALALGNTIGQTAVAIPIVIATRRIRGPAAVRRIGYATQITTR